MLGKLLKNEWKSFSLPPTVVMIIFAVFTGIVMCSFTTSFWEQEANIIVELFSSLAIFAYIFCLAAVSFSITLCTAVRFYKNLFTDEGYLMFTLPVKASQLLLSKGLIAALWRILSYIVIGLSIFGIGSIAYIYLEDVSIVEFFRNFSELLLEIFDLQSIREAISIPVSLLLIWIILLFVGTLFSNILFIYTCICLGQLFRKHKIGGAILSYFGLRFVKNFLEKLIMLPLPSNPFSYQTMFFGMGNVTSIEDFSVGTWLLIIFISLLVLYGTCTGMYFICTYLMTKKLNLE